jgi:oligopeptidase B
MRCDIRTGISTTLFFEEDDTYTIGVYKTLSKRYIVITSNATVSTEYQFLDLQNPEGELKVFLPREDDLEYFVGDCNGEFYIHTNYNALNFRLMKGNIGESKEQWTEVIPHRQETLIEDFIVFNDFLVVQERTNGLTQLQIINLQTNEAHYLQFDEPAYTTYLGVNLNRASTTLRIGYTSLTTPSSVIDYDMTNRTKVIKKEHEVMGDFDKNNYTAERIWATARDGVKVPISIVKHKKTPYSPQTPFLLYAYGSYGYSMDAYFSSVRLSLLDRGFIFAIAHIRGGEDLGRQWYDDGKMLKKKNTFFDFIDCTSFLIDQNYTSANKMFAMGGSAGGMLMGGIINMAPTLYKGIIAQVPFVDCVTTMLDDTIPLTTGEYDEWGNPNEKEYYDYMLTYSPYDNVEAKDYPAMLVTSGLHDSQVQYWEPTKWVAKLRAFKTDDNLLLLHTNMEAGHGGASGRFEIHKETALEYAFLLHLAQL